MFKLSYSLNSADLLPIEKVCDELAKFGYTGVELSFQRGQFDPLSISEERIRQIVDYFEHASIKPVCISTATTKFLSSVPHEPSLINVDSDDRDRRADLIAKGIILAEKIGVPLVSFQSGYVRDEHAQLSRSQVMEVLASEIRKLLKKIRGNVSLVLEPEPGMFIETLADARELIAKVADTRFGLHMDIGHVFCSEENYVETIRNAAKEARYVHMADIREGFNLKYLTTAYDGINKLMEQGAVGDEATLYDVDDADFYLFVHGERRIAIGKEEDIRKAGLLNDGVEILFIEENYLKNRETTDLRHEIPAYLDSVSGIDYERVLRAYNAVLALRVGSSRQAPVITRTVCNTVKGKVHYHDLFGKGKIEYDKVIASLIAGGYDGYCTVELYNHASMWREIAPRSAKYILSMIVGNFGWSPASFGHIDHRKVFAPYVRAADAQIGPEGGVAVLYDLRLSQPNTKAIATDALHTLEHCFLWLLPGLLPGFLGVGPMGCRTGLYITTAYPLIRDTMEGAIIAALDRIQELDEVPYQSDELCGMANTHDLSGAKAVARSVSDSMLLASH